MSLRTLTVMSRWKLAAMTGLLSISIPAVPGQETCSEGPGLHNSYSPSMLQKKQSMMTLDEVESSEKGSSCAAEYEEPPESQAAYAVFGVGACRGTSSTDNPTSWYTKPSFSGSLADCEALCTDSNTCKAVEYDNSLTTHCELWTQEPQATSGNEKWQCRKKQFGLADASTNACPAGMTVLADEETCQKVAGSFGSGMKAGSFKGTPKGCYFNPHKDKVYFNRHNTGGTRKRTSICQLVQFALADASTNACLAGMSIIADDQTCQNAAGQFGSWKLASGWDDTPKGCYVNPSDNGVFFNSHDTGGTGRSRTSICQTCSSTPGWASGSGKSCAFYATANFCTSSGDYGSGWSSDWGTFANHATDGVSAGQACCECGGGTRARTTVTAMSQVATSAECGEFCSATSCCLAYEYSSDTQICKNKQDKTGWNDCIKTPGAGEKFRIGFVGNSFTYYNNLPHLVQLLLGGSRDVEVRAVVRGGSDLQKTFLEGANPSDVQYIQCDIVAEVEDLFKDGGVDVLVLQDNSQGPLPDTRTRGKNSLATQYVPLIKKQSKKPSIVLYQTYAYDKESWTKFSFDAMTAELKTGYSEYEKELTDNGLDVHIARVGEAVQTVHSQNHDVWDRLYVPDRFHPNPQLTLLAATHIASVIAKQSARSFNLQFAKVWPCPMNCHPTSSSPRQSDIETILSIAGPENIEYIEGRHCTC